MATAIEGIHEALSASRWFNEKVKPNVRTAFFFEGSDNFIYQVVKTVNKHRGVVRIMVLKVTPSGWIKSTMNIPPEIAGELADVIKKLAGE